MKDNIKLIPEEEMLGKTERRFVDIIKYIENLTKDDEERIALFATFNRGIKAGINLFYETKNRIEYQKDPLSVYIYGVRETIFVTQNMIEDTLNLIKEREIEDVGIGISYIQIFMKGIDKAGDLYQRNILGEDVYNIVEDFDKILSEYEGKDPEEIWEKIRNRIGVSLKF